MSTLAEEKLREFDRFRGKRLLEIGCGMGTDLLQFARGGARCTGIDLTPRSAEITDTGSPCMARTERS